MCIRDRRHDEVISLPQIAVAANWPSFLCPCSVGAVAAAASDTEMNPRPQIVGANSCRFVRTENAKRKTQFGLQSDRTGEPLLLQTKDER